MLGSGARSAANRTLLQLRPSGAALGVVLVPLSLQCLLQRSLVPAVVMFMPHFAAPIDCPTLIIGIIAVVRGRVSPAPHVRHGRGTDLRPHAGGDAATSGLALGGGRNCSGTSCRCYARRPLSTGTRWRRDRRIRFIRAFACLFRDWCRRRCSATVGGAALSPAPYAWKSSARRP